MLVPIQKTVLNICCIISLTLVLFASTGLGSRDVPNRMVYQGTVYSMSDSSAVSGAYPIAVALFGDSLGGTFLWSEEFPSATVTKGIFHLILGGGTGIPDSLLDGRDLWVETTFDGDVLLPRQRIHPVAYALLANNANHAVMSDTALVAYSIPEHSHYFLEASNGDPVEAPLLVNEYGNVGIGTNSPRASLHIKFGSSGAEYFIGDGAIFESWTNGWFAVYTPNDCVGGLMVSDPEDFDEARFYYKHADNSWHLDGNGTQEMLCVTSAGNAGIGVIEPTSRLDINGDAGYNQLRLRNSYTPFNSYDPNGSVGDIAWDDNYLYVKTSEGWKRAALSSF
jgi:hypothetical protein